MEVRVIVKNVGRAQRVIDWIESKLKVTIGSNVGPFVLEDFQKDFIRRVYEPADLQTNRRIVRRAVFSVARKNGKSELAAALVLVHLIGPEAEMNGEIYSAANDREQAAIVFNAVKRMINAEPRFLRFLKIVDSTKTIFVKASGIPAEGSKFRALSADAGTKHGLNPSMVIYDELAQAKSEELLDTLLTSQGARSEPLFLTISTQSHSPTHRLTEMIEDGLKGEDPTMVAVLHAADDGCDVMDEAGWYAANPALGIFRSLDELRVMAARAKRLPSEEQAFRLLYLNQRVSYETALISRADWMACLPNGEFPDPVFTAEDTWSFAPGEAVYLGLDMSLRTDLTALVAVSAVDGSRVKSWFFKPTECLKDHGDRDRMRYDVHTKAGWMIATPGRSIDPAFVAAKIAAIHALNPLVGLAYDRAYTGELMRCMDAIGLIAQEGAGHGLRIEPWGQGFVAMGKAVNAFEHAVLQTELQSDGNPILSWCVANALVITDPAGNRKFDKSKAIHRLDGAVALSMALGLKNEDRLNEVVSAFEDEDFAIEAF